MNAKTKEFLKDIFLSIFTHILNRNIIFQHFWHIIQDDLGFA